MRRASLLLLACVALCLGSALSCEGPPPPLKHFSASRYAGTWYIQRIWGTGDGSMACAHMQYNLQSHPLSSPLFSVRSDFTVIPYLNHLTLTGQKRLPDAHNPSFFEVTPEAGPFNLQATPSWIVALADDYRRGKISHASTEADHALTRLRSWSAVVSGPPTEPSAFGCLPRERTGGMSIMTRARLPSDAVVKRALASLSLLVRSER